MDGSSILDNVLVPIETIHQIKCKVNEKFGEFSLKIDIRKAFEKLERNYLIDFMLKMGFDPWRVNWIKLYIESVGFNIIVNGDGVGPFSLKKGLRHGDPTSTHLFTFCIKALNTLLKKAKGIGDIHDINVCRGASTLSHLLFIDNRSIFL